MFDEPMQLALGLLTGFLFGFFLQKGRVAKFRVIMGQFLLRDFTVAKIMVTAIAVGAAGFWTLTAFGMATLQVKTAALGGVIVGAVLFGIGIAILGYCPGTGVAACGEGRRDAMVGVGGMFFGAFAYVLLYPALKSLINALGNLGNVTLPQVTRLPAWTYVVALAVAALLVWLLAGSHRREAME
jgi:uncharacterized protein